MVPFISTIAQDMKRAFEVLSSKNFNQAVEQAFARVIANAINTDMRAPCVLREAASAFRVNQ